MCLHCNFRPWKLWVIIFCNTDNNCVALCQNLWGKKGGLYPASKFSILPIVSCSLREILPFTESYLQFIHFFKKKIKEFRIIQAFVLSLDPKKNKWERESNGGKLPGPVTVNVMDTLLTILQDLSMSNILHIRKFHVFLELVVIVEIRITDV